MSGINEEQSKKAAVANVHNTPVHGQSRSGFIASG